MLADQGRLPPFYYVVLVVTTGLALTLAWPYQGVIAFSLLLVVICRPVYLWLLDNWLSASRKGVAVALTSLFLVLAVLVPGVWLLGIVLGQVGQVVEVVRQYAKGGASLTDLVNSLNTWIQRSTPFPFVRLDVDQVSLALRNVAAAVMSLGTQLLVSTSTSLIGLVANLFIFFAIFTLLLPNLDTTLARMVEVSPLGPEMTRRYLDKATLMTWSMFKGVFVIAVIQALILGAALWICGVPYTALLTFIAVICAVLPGGINLVGLPIALLFLATGGYWQGVLILVACFGVAANVDNYLRPRFVSQGAYLSPPLVLLATFGGIQMFGLWGAVYGPVLMVLFTTTLDLYVERRGLATQPAPPATGGRPSTTDVSGPPGLEPTAQG